MRRLLALTIATTLLLVTALAAAAYAPPQGGTFNEPRPWGNDAERYRIIRTVITAINRTQPTDGAPPPVIHISTYLLDHSPSVDALIGACRRGVRVRVILDDDIENWNSRRLIKALNSDNVKDDDGNGAPDNPPNAGPCNRKLRSEDEYLDPSMSVPAAESSVTVPTEDSVTWGRDGSYVKRCAGSCRGAGGNMHSKFYLFSQTGDAHHVVMVSSSNLNRGGAVSGWNDMFVMNNRPASHEGYVRIHREMTEDSQAGDGKVEVSDGPFVSRFFPMHDASQGNDPTLQDLNRIGCWSALGQTQVNVSMFYWAGRRGEYLASKLLDLARNGCRVSIIYGAPSVKIATRLRDAARRGLINLYDSRWDFNRDGYNEIRTHAKYVLVKGRVGADSAAYHVWTGSQNWVAGSLSKGDEVTLNIESPAAYRQYLANWARIRNHSRVLPYR